MNAGIKKALRITKKITFFFLKVLGIFILLLVVFIGFNITTIDKTPYKDMSYYKTTMQRVTQLKTQPVPKISANDDSLKAGWGQANFTPGKPVHLAGYGDRYGNSIGLQDSLRARAFVFDNAQQKIAMVTVDLLIMPPSVLETVHQRLASIGFSKDNVYFSATHSHNSVGHWGTKVVGQLLAGWYRQDIVDNIANAIITSIKQADKTKEYAQLGYVKLDAKDFVYNRLAHKKGRLDPWLRLLKIQKQSGKTAALFTFAAHSTCFASEQKPISGDYPNQVIRLLQKSPKIDFAAFFAGAMGSHAPVDVPGGNDYKQLDNLSKKLSTLILAHVDSIALKAEKQLFMRSMKIDLRAPQVKVSENWRIRPWLFYALYGNYPSEITALRIGDLVFVGTPCDFSGELVHQFEKVSKQRGFENNCNQF